MTYEQALEYIHSNHWQGKKPGLTRIRALLARLGDPQKRLKFIHVAGTNGKGSVCACLSSVLQAAGYRVGLYTSPFLIRFNERFQVNGLPISDEELCRVTQAIQPAAQSMEEPPTEFELITALAMVWFLQQRCDIVVLEVGLGGALDPTNVIDPPALAIITALGLDHTRELGDTLSQIAAAKAGIIKPGSPVVSYGRCPEADAVIARTAAEQGVPLTVPDWDSLRVRALEPNGTVMDFGSLTGLRLPLLAAYQPYNAALAITGLLVLREKGWPISDEAIRQGIAAVSWPGRFELLRDRPPFLLDGSHNPQGIRATAESLAIRYPGQKFVFLLGVMADKDVGAMIAALAPLAQCFVTLTPHTPRAMPAGQLAEEIFRETGLPAEPAVSISEGVERSLALAGANGVCALGSLYFSGDIRSAALPLLSAAAPESIDSHILAVKLPV